jgi:hypothetical protein
MLASRFWTVAVAAVLVSVPLVLSAQKPAKPPKPGSTANPAIAYELRRSNGYIDLMVMDADGRNQTRLVQGGDNQTPAWSPDGEWIAFVRSFTSSPGIYMVRPNGTELCRVVATSTIRLGRDLSRRPRQPMVITRLSTWTGRTPQGAVDCLP